VRIAAGLAVIRTGIANQVVSIKFRATGALIARRKLENADSAKTASNLA
jgi:hypothetical protein